MAKGVRPLTIEEMHQVAESFTGPMWRRNRALFLTQYYTGRRITQTLSLRLGDVLTPQGAIVDTIWFRRMHTKGKIEGQSVVLHPKARPALVEWIREMRTLGYMTSDCWLFPAFGRQTALTKDSAYQIYKRAFNRLGLEGRLGTHSLRKLYGRQVYQKSGKDIRVTQEALGHKNLANTATYIALEAEQVRRVILEAL